MHTQRTERKFLFLLGSARTGGNTEILARQAAEQLPAGTEQQWLRLTDLPLPDFEDLRHEGDGSYPAVTGHAKLLLDATLDATDLVIASPLYWYSVSTATKRYLDHWSGWMRVPGTDFKPRMAGRRLWGVTALSGRNPADADALAGTLHKTADYLRMEWGGVLLGNGTRPGDVLNDSAALVRAKEFFTR
ncbi:NAD(P)H-dependent oxidoreductase [Streptomyces sp. H10-C2]|uniref:flavodoxin family protein n=1 Tax=unclassified Streptomyces TaxID=2593676 RepID=UPI0024BB9E97|nr:MULTISPECIES: NAD(P)H-dependent oxidoreductase [unclassified Streptomyces]MDJ0342015.1 NAD(P)H-dependent oxidoreductase [Streptomyces sp. PH10-H1]MDJ0369988.1 NAD(P)H-dependent oxidoreductase [Streptomyces sp. H10-C2]MDJ0370011.1 NAD(P)H-dependent oxidoreductase [Streptomyces sp. H10-C2]